MSPDGNPGSSLQALNHFTPCGQEKAGSEHSSLGWEKAPGDEDPAPACFTEASSTSQQEMRSGVKAMSNPGCPTSPPSPHPAALSK